MWVLESYLLKLDYPRRSKNIKIKIQKNTKNKKGAYQAPNKKEKRDFIRKYLAKFDQ